MSQVQRFYKTSIVYFLGRVSSALITFLLLPVYTSNIDPEPYGYYELTISVLAVIVPVLFFEVWSGVLRLSYDDDTEEYKNKIISTGFVTMAIPMIIFIVGIYVYNMINPTDCIGFIFIYVIFWVINLILGMVARTLQANFVFATSGIVGSITNGCVGVFCVYVLGWQAEALFMAMIASFLMQNIYIFLSLKLWKRISFKLYDKELSWKLVVFCFPFTINTIAYYLQNNYNKVLIDTNLGSAEVGIFSVAGKFMIVASLLASIFHLAWQETTFSLSNNSERAKFYTIGLNAFLKLTVIGSIILLPVVKILFPFMIGSEYSSALDIIPIYYISVFTTTMSVFVCNILTAEKRTSQLVIGKLIGCVFNIGIMYAFIDKIGIMAVVLAFLIGTTVELIATTILVKKIVDIKIEYKPLILFVVFYTISAIIFSTTGLVVNILWFIVCFVVGISVTFKIIKGLKNS